MKLYDLFMTSLEEINKGKWMLIPTLLMSAMMIAVSIILFNISQGAMDVIYTQFNEEFQDGVDIVINNVEFDDIKKIESLGCDIYKAECTSLIINTIKFKDNYGKEVKGSASALWYTGKDNMAMLRGLKISSDFNYSKTAYIVYPPDKMKDYMNIESVEMLDRNNQTKCVLEVKKKMPDLKLFGSEEAVVFVPLYCISEAYKGDGIYPSVSVTVKVSKVEQYSLVKQKLFENGYYPTSQIDEFSNVVSMLNVFFKSMAVLVIFLSIVSLMTICNMYFSSRQKHIILKKTLGMSSKTVFASLFVIIFIMVSVSVLLAMLIVFFGNSYIYSVLKDVFGEFNYNVSSTFISSLIAFIIAVAVAGISSIGIYRKTKDGDIVTLMNKSD